MTNSNAIMSLFPSTQVSQCLMKTSTDLISGRERMLLTWVEIN